MVTLQVLAALLLLDTGALCTPVDYRCNLSASQVSRATDASGASFLQRSHKARKTKSTHAQIRFPFELVLFPHLPKVGGSTMRGALRDLCRARGQKLQFCYNDIRCTDENALAWEELALTANQSDHDPYYTPWGLHNVSDAANQIVYGHGVRAGFERAWGLDNSTTRARIAVLREPVSLLLSAWAHQNRQSSYPNYNLTLDQWISAGKAEAFVDYYASFFLVDFEAPDPWDPRNPAAFEVSSGSPILTNNPAWRHQLADALDAPNILVLLQDDWEWSMDQLAHFLHLVPTERDRMLSILQGNVTNLAPGVDIHLRKDNFARLTKAVEPLQFIYNRVRDLDSGKANTAAAQGQRKAFQGPHRGDAETGAAQGQHGANTPAVQGHHWLSALVQSPVVATVSDDDVEVALRVVLD